RRSGAARHFRDRARHRSQGRQVRSRGDERHQESHCGHCDGPPGRRGAPRTGWSSVRQPLRILQKAQGILWGAKGESMTRGLLIVAIAGATLGSTVGHAADKDTLDTAQIERLTGAKGKLDLKENVFKVSVPRANLRAAAPQVNPGAAARGVRWP